MQIGERIKSVRLQQALTLEDLSKKVGVSRQTLSRYETGIISNIPSDNIEKLAKALNTSPAHLMGWADAEDRFVSWDEPTFSVTTGNINLDEEIKALIGRINTAKKVKFNGENASEISKMLAKNTLDSLLKNMELILE